MVETRLIVCEGKCNPDIYDFDSLAHRQVQFGDIRPYLRERVEKLVHTTHELTRNTYYDVRMGWTRSWRCQVCGHSRKF